MSFLVGCHPFPDLPSWGVIPLRVASGGWTDFPHRHKVSAAVHGVPTPKKGVIIVVKKIVVYEGVVLKFQRALRAFKMKPVCLIVLRTLV